VHFSPSSERCDALAESAFHLLSRRYAKSVWAQKNKFWYRGGGSPLPQPRGVQLKSSTQARGQSPTPRNLITTSWANFSRQ
jgi:hypothetical protein